jgi:hypothetical protein
MAVNILTRWLARRARTHGQIVDLLAQFPEAEDWEVKEIVDAN